MFGFALVRVGFDFDGLADTALKAGLRGRVASFLDAKVRRSQRVDDVEVDEEGGAVVSQSVRVLFAINSRNSTQIGRMHMVRP